MRKDAFVYISGPITANGRYSVEQNVADSLPTYFKLLRLGIPAFCPHLSGAFPTAFSIDYETWIAYDFAVIDRCTHMLMLPRWKASNGAKREREYAIGRGTPVAESIDQLVTMIG
jgi:uncharacterized protein DUF4406